MHRKLHPAWWGLLSNALIAATPAAEAVNPIPDDATFEQLSQISVSAVSRKDRSWLQSPAAVFVISGDEIRRSGAHSIPEALRLSPGVNVARISASRYAISIRGFNGEFANKLLVLQDGRSLYTPVFAGTFWEMQDTLLADVNHIEIVRGPGGTSWGTNAMNGVINIITKDARHTQGTRVSAGGGTEERAFASVRHGLQTGPASWLRVYGQGAQRDDTAQLDGAAAGDEWDQWRGGFRYDAEPTRSDLLTLQADVFGSDVNRMLADGSPNVVDESGGNVLGRWRRTFSSGAQMTWQLYFDSSRLETGLDVANRDEVDLEGQHRFTLGERQEINWGLHLRYSDNHNAAPPPSAYTPSTRDYWLASLFAEDEFTLIAEVLRFSMGAKAEHNDFTGWEVLPNARLSWTPRPDHFVWLALSRSARTPSIADNDRTDRFQVGPVTLLNLPNRNLDSEVLTALESGWRMQGAERFTLGASLFYNDYDQLRSREASFSTPPPTTLTLRDELIYGESYGFEIAGSWRPLERWRMQAAYSFLSMHLHRRPQSTDVRSVPEEGNNPQQQVSLRSSLDFGQSVEWDLWLRYVDPLPNLDIASYVTLDLRLAWWPSGQWEVSLTGQNLLDSQHPEFRALPGQPPASEIERGIYGQAVWRF